MATLTKGDKKLVKKTMGFKSKPMAKRKHAHDSKRSNYETPPGYQPDSPEHHLELMIQDAAERKYQLFFGRRQDAVVDGNGDLVDHEIEKWIDVKDGEYKFVKRTLRQMGFRIEDYAYGVPNDRVLAVKEVTVEEAWQNQLELRGKVGQKVTRRFQFVREIVNRETGDIHTEFVDEKIEDAARYPDDDPDTYWKREYARRALGEIEPSNWRDEIGKRGRKDRAYNDPDDVPWKDDTLSDWFGTGVQTIEIAGETMWFQERKLYGARESDDGSVYEVEIGLEQVVRPFSDLIIPAQYKWWDVYDSEKRPVSGLDVYKFNGFFEAVDQIKAAVDNMSKGVEVRGVHTLPWGETVVRVLVPIPKSLRERNHMLFLVDRFRGVKYFCFDVRGPAVPALRDEFERRCRRARSKKAVIKLPEWYRRVLAGEKLEIDEFLEDDLIQRLVVLGLYNPESVPGICATCGRKIPDRRIDQLLDMIEETRDRATLVALLKGLSRCVRTQERSDPSGEHQLVVTYCDGTDLSKVQNQDMVS